LVTFTKWRIITTVDTDFSVTTGTVTTTLWSGITVAADAPPSSITGTTGKVTAAIYATNMCNVGQTSGCYASPNRVAVSIGYSDHDANNYDFSIMNGTDHTVTAESIFDITIQLNTFGATTGWTWVNGELLYFAMTSTTLRIKLRPALTPSIDWAAYPNTGCTATPIRDCEVTKTSGNTLAANFFWSVDTTNSYLSGAAFATTGAILGFLNPQFTDGSMINPTLQYTLSGAHFQADGTTLQIGFLRSIIPLTIVHNLFPGFTTQDPASYFNVTRVGSGTSTGSQFSTWTVADQGVSALAFDVSGVTFSAPTYEFGHANAASRATAQALIVLLGIAVCFMARVGLD